MATTYISTVIVVTHDGMGSATAPLQHLLLKNYLSRLLEKEFFPDAICFYTEGIKMVIDDSPVLRELKKLEERGVDLIACRACLDYYHYEERLAVGRAGDMGDIVEAQWGAAKVITI